jgi:hypothetical protein
MSITDRFRQVTRTWNRRWEATLNDNAAYHWDEVDDEEDEEDEEDELVSLSASSTSISDALRRRQQAAIVEDDVDEVFEDIDGEAQSEEATVKFINDKPAHVGMYITEAMRIARKIQKKYPKKIICGGLALHLYKVIERVKFSDVDFVAYEKNVVPGECISLTCTKPYPHCLFLSSDLRVGETIEGLKLQALDQIIHWKMRYGRKKDLEDLKKYQDSQFFNEEEFIINM